MLVRNELIKATRKFFDERDFVLIDAPILTPASVEGTTTLFETDYFDDKPTSPKPGSCIWKQRPWPSGRCTASAPPLGRRSPRPGVT